MDKKFLVALIVLSLFVFINSVHADSSGGIGATLTVPGSPTPPPSPSPQAGGNAGAGAMNATVPYIDIYVQGVHTIQNAVHAGDNLTFPIDVFGSPFDRLTLVAAQDINSGTINITTEGCQNHSLQEGEIFYDCATVRIDGITVNQYNAANLNFRVSKVWLAIHNVSPSAIGVKKFNDGNMQVLNVNNTGSDIVYYHYTAQFLSFSDFIIYGLPGKVTAGGNCPQVSYACYEILSLCWYWWLLLGLVGVIVWQYYKSEKGNKKRKAKRKSR